MNKIRRLTQKQMSFCMRYIESGNASAAYRQCYNAGKMKPETVNRKATELLANGTITARIELLQEEAKKRFEVSVEKKKAWLVEVIEHSLKDESWDGSEVIRAISELNKMDGDHASTKIENSVFLGGKGKPMMNVQINFIKPCREKPTKGRVIELGIADER